MKKNLALLLILFQLFFLKADDSKLKLNIYRSKSHEDQTGSLTPLVISLSSDDVKEKTTNADLIFVVDISGSMSGTRLKLVKETLNYIVDITNENDNIALITFESYAHKIMGLTKMTEANKNTMRAKINALSVTGGTNIYVGLEMGLQQIIKDYTSGDRVCSIIMLSDGYDNYQNADTRFANLVNNGAKKNYIFTTHVFGYGQSHDAVLMNKISLIRDGMFFAIKEFTQVKSAFIKI